MARTPKKTEVAAIDPEVISYKGFNLNWTCRNFQFAIGQTYQHKGDVVACESGWHACEYPLDVFGYYPPGSSRYAEVRQSGKLTEHSSDTKIASARLTVSLELSVPDLVTRAIAWITERATEKAEHVKGDQSAASSTGDRSAASSTGYRSAASSTGDRSAASSTGDQSAASSTGDRSAASSTGDQSAASSTGYRSAAMSAGMKGRVMGKNGNALFLVYRDPSDWSIKHAWAGIVGCDGIKELTWYQLGADGMPVEVSQEAQP